MPSLRKTNLKKWQNAVLDTENAEAGEAEGPDAEVGRQTVIHHLNLISKFYNDWADDNEISLVNPVGKGLRPSVAEKRSRRLVASKDKKKCEDARFFAACGAS